MSKLRNVALGAAVAYGVSGTVFATLVRPRISRWGATDEEVTKRLPGDSAFRTSLHARHCDSLFTKQNSGGSA